MKQCGSYQVVGGIFTETIMLRGCVILRHINRPQTAAVRECLYLLWKRLEMMAESTFNLIRERGGFDVYEEWIFFMLPPVETGHQLLAISSSHFPISPLSQSVNINRSKIMLAKCQFQSVKSSASPFSKPLRSFCTSIPSFLSHLYCLSHFYITRPSAVTENV